ncbi:hypothetical protein D1641_05280 [Colidextribacter sp. OB.20]|uniref:hypothetical protein n=1 Tax=Colidextribacter sp. OB.20 TaxID=2304568 RepID=UPI00136EC40C|nr:hypothetical protein [Colidextribacter sp. OB.20]NBI09434.1 hypothetical protein [Colidextribacter sp. OB.20]
MKKRLIKGAVAVAVLAGIFLCARWIDMELNYTVLADNSNLEECAVRFLQHGELIKIEVKLHDSIDLGDKRYVLIERMENGEYQLGLIRMEQGLNGRYKINSIGYGSSNFREEVVESGDEKFYMLGGRNTFFGIVKVKTALNGREYTMRVPEGERFLVYTEIDPLTEARYSDLEKLRFYNESGEDITAQVPWN